MEIILKPNKNNHHVGEVVDLCVPHHPDSEQVSVWCSANVDFFHGTLFYEDLRANRTVTITVSKATVDAT